MRSFIAVLVFLGACSGGHRETTPGPTGTSPGPTGTSTGPACGDSTVHGFAATPTSWSIPAARCQTSFDAFGGYDPLSYALLDVTHDGRADVVVSKDACDATVGQSHWDVYAAGDAGFASAPSSWAIPAARCQVAFDALAGADELAYTLFDLDGDGRSDLVVTKDACDATVGQTHWDVYAGGANGFSAVPKSWPIPAGRCQTSFDALAGSDEVRWQLLDLDADGHVDLLVTKDACDATVGQTHWDRYAGSASGFAAAPQGWAIPAARCQASFDTTAGAGDLAWTTLDLDGDGHADLFVTKDACDATVGATHWDLYHGGTNGFAAAPTAFGVPAPRCQAHFDATALSPAAGALGASLVALTCGSPALLVTHDDCDATVGDTHWDAYDWSASGFASVPRSITVPAARCQQSFDALGGDGALTYGLYTLAHAGQPSLVVAHDPCATDVGTTSWDLYAAQ